MLLEITVEYFDRLFKLTFFYKIIIIIENMPPTFITDRSATNVILYSYNTNFKNNLNVSSNVLINVLLFYLSTTSISSTYLLISSASSTYLKISNASSTYLSQASASSTFLLSLMPVVNTSLNHQHLQLILLLLMPVVHIYLKRQHLRLSYYR
jgi:hypothetical protein